MTVSSHLESMLILKIPEGSKSIARLWSQHDLSKPWRRRRRERDKTKHFTSREKALHVRLTICASQRPRQNINIHSHPNLRGERTGKPTTSCLCFCLNSIGWRARQTKDFTSRKSRAKAPHVCSKLCTPLKHHLTVTNICLVWQREYTIQNSTPLTHVTCYAEVQVWRR